MTQRWLPLQSGTGRRPSLQLPLADRQDRSLADELMARFVAMHAVRLTFAGEALSFAVAGAAIPVDFDYGLAAGTKGVVLRQAQTGHRRKAFDISLIVCPVNDRLPTQAAPSGPPPRTHCTSTVLTARTTSGQHRIILPNWQTAPTSSSMAIAGRSAAIPNHRRF